MGAKAGERLVLSVKPFLRPARVVGSTSINRDEFGGKKGILGRKVSAEEAEALYGKAQETQTDGVALRGIKVRRESAEGKLLRVRQGGFEKVTAKKRQEAEQARRAARKEERENSAHTYAKNLYHRAAKDLRAEKRTGIIETIDSLFEVPGEKIVAVPALAVLTEVLASNRRPSGLVKEGIQWVLRSAIINHNPKLQEGFFQQLAKHGDNLLQNPFIALLSSVGGEKRDQKVDGASLLFDFMRSKGPVELGLDGFVAAFDASKFKSPLVNDATVGPANEMVSEIFNRAVVYMLIDALNNPDSRFKANKEFVAETVLATDTHEGRVLNAVATHGPKLLRSMVGKRSTLMDALTADAYDKADRGLRAKWEGKTGAVKRHLHLTKEGRAHHAKRHESYKKEAYDLAWQGALADLAEAARNVASDAQTSRTRIASRPVTETTASTAAAGVAQAAEPVVRAATIVVPDYDGEPFED